MGAVLNRITNRNDVKNIIALELKRLGDWGQIENIVYINEIRAPVANQTIFVTCDKIAAHIAMCYKVPTLANFDKENEGGETDIGNPATNVINNIIKKVRKTVSEAALKIGIPSIKTFLFYSPSANPAIITEKLKLSFRTKISCIFYKL